MDSIMFQLTVALMGIWMGTILILILLSL